MFTFRGVFDSWSYITRNNVGVSHSKVGQIDIVFHLTNQDDLFCASQIARVSCSNAHERERERERERDSPSKPHYTSKLSKLYLLA